jgi:hypothetical protein
MRNRGTRNVIADLGMGRARAAVESATEVSAETRLAV